MKRDASTQPPPERSDSEASDYLRQVGERVRRARARRGMTRKILARRSGVSERYLAQLESGRGNISILLLRQVAQTLNVPLQDLAFEGPEPSAEFAHLTELLRTLPPDALPQARKLLTEHFANVDPQSRHQRVALVGLRGAGKSTLGSRLADRLQVPFIELDRLIEEEAGVPVGVVLDLYGQNAFRRTERRCLENVLERYPRFVLATGGSLVSESATFERLLIMCFTVWLRATPEEHMQRVVAQGDLRPMADNREAMSDLRGILEGRHPLYSRADAMIDTSSKNVAQSLEALVETVREGFAGTADAPSGTLQEPNPAS